MSTVRRTFIFLTGIAAIASVNTLLKWPKDLGRAHWSEWFAFYFSPPFLYAGILLLIFYVLQRRQINNGRREVIKLPLQAVFWTVFIFIGITFVRYIR